MMNEQNDYATLVIQHHILPGAKTQYEAWVKQIAQEGQRFKGHLGVNVIRPHGTATSYTIVLRFDSHDNLQGWIQSETRKRLVRQAQPLLTVEEDLELQTGLEYWFTPPSGKPAHAKPFKQFLVTLSAIFPLTLLVPWLLKSILVQWPFSHYPIVMHFVDVMVIVLLMVYVIMPRYTRLVAGWLFR